MSTVINIKFLVQFVTKNITMIKELAWKMRLSFQIVKLPNCSLIETCWNSNNVWSVLMDICLTHNLLDVFWRIRLVNVLNGRLKLVHGVKLEPSMVIQIPILFLNWLISLFMILNWNILYFNPLLTILHLKEFSTLQVWHVPELKVLGQITYQTPLLQVHREKFNFVTNTTLIMESVWLVSKDMLLINMELNVM